MAKRKRRKARRAKRRGFGGTAEEHRTKAAQTARQAQRFFRTTAHTAREGFCSRALLSYRFGAELWGRYRAERAHARTVGARLYGGYREGKAHTRIDYGGAEFGLRTAHEKAQEALVAACFR